MRNGWDKQKNNVVSRTSITGMDMKNSAPVMKGDYMKTRSFPFCFLFVMTAFPAVSQSDIPAEGWTIKEEIQIGDYTYQCKSHEEEGSTFQILRASDTVFSATKCYYFIEILPVGEPLSVQSTPPNVAKDITKDGTPDLVIQVHSGGAHCCFGYYAFSLGSSFKKMVYFDGIDAEFQLKDMDDDGIYEFVGHDDTFAYWNASFAESPMPDVILRYEGDGLHLATDLMRQLIPNPDVIMERVTEYREILEKKGNSPLRFNTGFYMDFYPPLWASMLDLIYAGWGDKAYEFFERAWPEQKVDRGRFLEEFKKRLAKSPYWDELKKMNGWQEESNH